MLYGGHRVELIRLSPENITEYTDAIPADFLENIGREFFGGMVVISSDTEETLSAAIWELRHLEDELKDNEAVIRYFTASDQDAGRMLLTEYEELLQEEDITMSLAMVAGEEEGAECSLLKEFGYTLEQDESPVVRVTMEELRCLDIMKKTKVPSYIKPFTMLSERDFQRGLMNMLFYQKREIEDDLAYLPFEWFDPVASCYCETDGKASGFFLVHKMRSGDFRAEFLGAIGPGAQKDLFHIIRFAILRGAETYGWEAKVLLPRRDEVARKLITYFFPEKKGEIYMKAQKEVGA